MDRENIEEILKRLGSEDVSADVHKIAEETSQKFSKTLMPSRQHILWENIMKSRVIKLAAAAVIIIAVLIGINQFGGSTSAFAAMIKNAEQMPWIHMVVFKQHGSHERKIEMWVCPRSNIKAQKWDDNRLTFISGIEQKEYLYDPEQDKIFISPVVEHFSLGFYSPISLMRTFIGKLESEAVSIETEEKLIDGTQTEIITARMPKATDTANVVLFRDIQNNLLTHLEVIFLDQSKNISTIYEYLETGPTSIYDLGLSNEVEIVNLIAPPQLKELREKIDGAAAKATTPYVAIGIPCDSSELPRSFNSERNASISLWRNEDSWRCDLGYYAEHSMLTPEILTEDIQYSAKLLTPAISYIVARGNTYTLVRKEWGDGKIHKRFSVSYPGNLSIEEVCWPRMRGTVGVPVNWKVESITGSNGESLILIERAQDGRAPNDKGMYVMPTRDRWFFNPERNYICQKHERSVFLHADWVINKHWLEGPKNPRFEWAGRDYETVVEVLDYAQTSSGRWYPRVLSEAHLWYNDNTSGEAMIDQTSSYSICRKIYLEENPDFPPEIFDPETMLD